jgi:hypothetical protein
VILVGFVSSAPPEELVILLELCPEPLVGMHNRPLLLGQPIRVLDGHTHVLHHIGNHNTRRPGLASMAVHQNIASLGAILPNELRALLEVLADVVVLGVGRRDELVRDVEGLQGVLDQAGTRALEEGLT